MKRLFPLLLLWASKALAGASLAFGFAGEAVTLPAGTLVRAGPWIEGALSQNLGDGAWVEAAGRLAYLPVEGRLARLLLHNGPLTLGIAPIEPGQGRYLVPFEPAGPGSVPLAELRAYPTPALALRATVFHHQTLVLWLRGRYQTAPLTFWADAFLPEPLAFHLAASGTVVGTLLYGEATLAAEPILLVGAARYLGATLATLEAAYHRGAWALALGLAAPGGQFALRLQEEGASAFYRYRVEDGGVAFQLDLGLDRVGARLAARLTYLIDLEE